MANVDATKIHQGPGKLWLEVTAPATGNRLIIDSSGTPTEGTPVFAGATDGAATMASCRSLLIARPSLLFAKSRLNTGKNKRYINES